MHRYSLLRRFCFTTFSFLIVGSCSLVAQPTSSVTLSYGSPSGLNYFGTGLGIGLMYAKRTSPAFSFGGSIDFSKELSFDEDISTAIGSRKGIYRPYGIELFSFAAVRFNPVWWTGMQKHSITLRAGPAVSFTYAPSFTAVLADRSEVNNYEVYDATMRGGGIHGLRADISYSYTVSNQIEVGLDIRLRKIASFDNFALQVASTRDGRFSSTSRRVNYRAVDVRLKCSWLLYGK